MGKIINLIMGLLLIFIGAVPLLQSQGLEIIFLPEEVAIYQALTVILGVLLLFFTFRRKYKKVKKII